MSKIKKNSKQVHGSRVSQGYVSAKLEDNREPEIAKPLSLEERSLKAAEIKKEMAGLSKQLDDLNGIENGPPLNVYERAMIESWKDRKEKSESQFHCDTVLKAKTKNGSIGEKYELIKAALFFATGSSDLDFSYAILSKCIQASCIGKNYEDPSIFDSHFNSITNAMTGLKPQDEIEGMLISRLVALHFQGIHYLACAATKESTTEARDININRSTKLSRVYNETLEALMRYRRKGEQKVIVQHVNVNDGGKAVVNGNLVSESGGK